MNDFHSITLFAALEHTIKVWYAIIISYLLTICKYIAQVLLSKAELRRYNLSRCNLLHRDGELIVTYKMGEMAMQVDTTCRFCLIQLSALFSSFTQTNTIQAQGIRQHCVRKIGSRLVITE